MSGQEPPTSSQYLGAAFETLAGDKVGAVLFVEITAPPMNLLGPELVRDLVSVIEQAEADSAVHVLEFQGVSPLKWRNFPRDSLREEPDYAVCAAGVVVTSWVGFVAISRVVGAGGVSWAMEPSER